MTDTKSKFTPAQLLVNRVALLVLVIGFIVSIAVSNRVLTLIDLEGFGAWIIVASLMSRKTSTDKTYSKALWWGLAWMVFVGLIFGFEIHHNSSPDLLRAFIAIGGLLFLLGGLVTRVIKRRA